MERISRNLRNVGSVTKVLSIISIVISLLMVIIGFMFKEVIDGIENNNQNQEDDMMVMGIFVLIYMFFVFLASLRFIGIGMFILSVLFLFASIIFIKYSYLEINELQRRKPMLIGMVMLYLIPSLLLIILNIMMMIDVGFMTISFFILPILLLSLGGYHIIKTILLINDYKEEKVITLEASNVGN